MLEIKSSYSILTNNFHTVGFATLLRNPNGILVADVQITSLDILKHLRTVMPIDKAGQLLDPADKQNVPKAVNLIQALRKVEDTPSADKPPDSLRHQRISFLARFFMFFVLPFISLEMSLSEQVRSLATYAHLLIVLWLKHTTSFITGALYADSQSIIKNIIITIARLQEISPEAAYYIILEGTDRLERLFGDCRTQDHSRNFDILQFCDKLSISTAMRFIFERNPLLDRGHERLNLKDATGVDHVNPASWRGDVTVGKVNLAREWTAGRNDATIILKAYLGIDSIDFGALFADRTRDLLRPRGAYVGIDLGDDDIRTHSSEEDKSVLVQFYDGSDDVREYYQLMDGAVNSTDSPFALYPEDDVYDDIEPESDWENDNEYEDIPEGVDLDQWIALDGNTAEGSAIADYTTSSAGPEMHSTPDRNEHGSVVSSEVLTETIAHPHHIFVDGKMYLTDSVVTSFLTSGRSRKVTMRTLRARGLTIEDLRRETSLWNTPDIPENDSVKCGDLAALLVRAGSSICLAVTEILAFEKTSDRSKSTSIAVEDLGRQDSGVVAVLQVLEMIPEGRKGESRHRAAEMYMKPNLGCSPGRANGMSLLDLDKEVP